MSTHTVEEIDAEKTALHGKMQALREEMLVLEREQQSKLEAYHEEQRLASPAQPFLNTGDGPKKILLEDVSDEEVAEAMAILNEARNDVLILGATAAAEAGSNGVN